ncbi:MAG: hypothetical protein NTY64_20300, partial [Deltaproteobacteria bacterium]|nr:hypothetical protein [Deltaproteobacteria bacterium]
MTTTQPGKKEKKSVGMSKNRGKRKGPLMRKELLWGVIMTVSLIALAHAELKSSPIHRDEPAEYTFETRFSLDMALLSLQKIQASLQSFQKLTEEA